jgi:hypothetical protein
MYIPATAGIQVGEEGGQKEQGAGRIYCTHTRNLLTTIPLLLFLHCFFVFFFFRWFFVYCIVFLELLPSSDGVHARLWICQVSLFLSRRLQQTLLLNLSTCQRNPVNNHTNSLINLRYYRGAGVCRVFSNTSRVHSEQQ